MRSVWICQEGQHSIQMGKGGVERVSTTGPDSAGPDTDIRTEAGEKRQNIIEKNAKFALWDVIVGRSKRKKEKKRNQSIFILAAVLKYFKK